jgi:hypothetical protein
MTVPCLTAAADLLLLLMHRLFSCHTKLNSGHTVPGAATEQTVSAHQDTEDLAGRGGRIARA